MSSQQSEEVLRGVVKRVTFRNPENGYSVLQVSVDDRSDPVTVVGTCLAANVGTNLLVRGEFKTHPKFGEQFSASTITETAPTSEGGIEKYLGNRG